MALSKIVLFLNLFIISLSANSAVTLTGISGASNFDLTTKKIYGGTTGPCPSGGDASLTCNTCSQAADPGVSVLKPCNQKNIHGALNIVFSFQSSSDLSKWPVKLSIGNSDGTSLTELTQLSSGPAAKTDATISTTWSSVCSLISGMNSSCEITSSADQTVSTDKSFFIDVDENESGTLDTNERTGINIVLHAINPLNTTYDSQPYCAGGAGSGYGLCFFSLETGDEKLVILETPTPLGNASPPDGSPAFQSVAFFAFPQAAGISVTGISNGLVQPVIKDFVSTTDLSIQGEPHITGLTNYERYCVFAGQMNLAQNIFGFTTTSVDQYQMCKQTSKVVGVLDGKECFISTAAFGSDMAAEVEIFRNFRDTFLLTNYYGIQFVKSYYKYGPIGAEFISDSNVLKTLTRAGLYPLVGFSWVALNYGIWPAMFVLLLTLILLFNLRKKIGEIFKLNRIQQQGRL